MRSINYARLCTRRGIGYSHGARFFYFFFFHDNEKDLRSNAPRRDYIFHTAIDLIKTYAYVYANLKITLANKQNFPFCKDQHALL